MGERTRSRTTPLEAEAVEPLLRGGRGDRFLFGKRCRSFADAASRKARAPLSYTARSHNARTPRRLLFLRIGPVIDDQTLQSDIEEIVEEAGAEQAAIAFYDYETGTSWSHHGDRWFHAASTIKVAVLAGVYRAIEEGRFGEEDRLHVRNRFRSAVEGAPYRIEGSRDADNDVFSQRGKTMKIGDLARHMIVTSSNLATNLLLDLVGVDEVQALLDELGVEGVSIERGVEDEEAFQEGINNRVTALGLLKLFRLIHEGDAFSDAARSQMMDILYAQHFNSGIPAGLPDGNGTGEVRVAHKTGEISTVAHDAGLISLPDREPYVLAVLTEWERDKTSGRHDTLAAISRAIYERLED